MSFATPHMCPPTMKRKLIVDDGTARGGRVSMR
jgi:hypothetical protein